MRILLWIPFSILIFYLTWQGLKINEDATINFPSITPYPSNALSVQHLNTSTANNTSSLNHLNASALQFICDRQSDSLELVKLYNATGGPNWWKKWDLKKPIDTWFGVSLNSDGCVSTIGQGDTVLDKSCCVYVGNNLTGSLISLNLPNLTSLSLNDNKLTGSIPNFSQLPNLIILALSANQLSDTIPNFDKMPNLIYLGLAHNSLMGSIPNFDKLPKLGSLQLGENQLSGPIPNFDKIPIIERLGLNDNDLTGTIPNFNLPILVTLALQTNQLTGNIPNFDKLPRLGSLGLHINKLTGSVPNFDKLPLLEGLALFENQLTGSIPNFDKIPNLQNLSLDNNKLTGFIPNFENLPKLIDMRLNDNNLEGFISDYSIYNPHLYLSNIYGNKLTFSSLIKNYSINKNLIDVINVPSYGFIYYPQQKIYSDTMISVVVNSNYSIDLKIDDTVTTSTYTWYKNGVIDTVIKGKNKLPFIPFTANDAGAYTVKITNPLVPQLTLESWPIKLVASPQLVCDRRSDSLELVKFYIATGGSNWYKKWDLKMPISEWHGIELKDGCVVSIDLEDTVENNSCCTGSGNNLASSIYSLNLPFLKLLDLGKNKLSGDIPNFDNLPNLESLDLYGNKLTGPIPNFDKLTNLTNLDLGGNQLSGSIPNFNKLSSLNRLVLDENQLTGTIPNFDKLANLNYLTLSINPLSGSIPNFDKLPGLVSLGLVKDQLTGAIPNFNNLSNLKFLHLRLNDLTGSIPNFNKLPKLIELELSNNSLSGKIPEFTKLPNLESFGAGSNKLAGSIPTFMNCPLITDIYVARNNLNGYLPDYTILLPNLSSIIMNDNKFTFSGIIQNANKILVQTMKVSNGRMIYHPQQCIYSDTTISIPSASNYTLDLKIDDTVTTSTYTWSKNGVFYKTIKGVNKLSFLPFTNNDDGTYTVKITNPLAPQLTLESCPIRLQAKNNCISSIINIDLSNSSNVSCKGNDGRITAQITGGTMPQQLLWSNGSTSPTINNLSIGKYTITVTDGQGCNKTDSITIKQSNTKSAIAIVKQPSCSNSKDGLLQGDFSKISGFIPITLTWIGEGVRIGNTFSGIGIKPNSLVITDFRGCTDTATVILKPLIDFKPSLLPDHQNVKYQTAQLFDVISNDNIPQGVTITVSIDNPKNGNIIYSQSTGKGTFTPNKGFSGKETLNYKICPTACSEDCATSTIEFNVEPACSDKTNLVLPNVIFPTGSSGDNKYFVVEALIKCPEAFGPKPTKLLVFNRWGDQVYRSDDYKNDWEGTNIQGQPLPEGTYYYLLDLGSVSAPVKGYVVIMRY